MTNENICNKCQKEAFQKCGGCQIVFYCSKEHQKLDWKQHKRVCQLFLVSCNPEIGRHLIATRNVKPNELILKERPLIYGPAQDTIPVCLGCCQEITNENYRPCSKCGWPMCSEQCEKMSCHTPECEYTTRRGEKVTIVNNFGAIHPLYSCITVLRCLYQKKYNIDVWKQLNVLQSHCEERKLTEKYKNEKVNIAQFIQRFFKLKDEFTEEEIMRVSGIVMVNAHEVPLSDPPYIAVYQKTSMFEHNCKSNCHKSFTDKGEILLVSVRCQNRQNGTCDGYLLPKTFLTLKEEPENWYCNKCTCSVSHFLVNALLEKIGTDLANLEKDDVTACQKFISKFEKILPPTNFYLTEVKLTLGQLIGQENPGGLSDVSNGDLEQKRKICQELIDLTKILIPCEKRVRGLLLFELHASLAELGRRRSLNFLNVDDVNSILKESRTHLMECIDLLKYEPNILPEGKVYQQAIKNLNDLNNLLRRQKVVLEDVIA